MSAVVAPLGVSGSYPCTQVKTSPESVEGQHRARFWAYPDGSWELLAVKMPAAKDCSRPVVRNDLGLVLIRPESGSVIKLPRSRCPGLSLCDQLLNRAGNARRAAVKCRRLARANSMRYMSTLTFPETVPFDRSTRCSLFQRFVRRYRVPCSRKSMGKMIYPNGYLMFPEQHKSGATHLHVLHSNRVNAVLLRYIWTRYLTVACGYALPHGTLAVRTHEKDWGSASEAAFYASKYVSKDFTANDREHGKRRYYPSLGLADGSVLLSCPPLVSVIARFGRSPVVAFSDSDDFVEWFYCGGNKRPPDLSDWVPWESVN